MKKEKGENNYTMTAKENARYLQIMRKETPPLKKRKKLESTTDNEMLPV